MISRFIRHTALFGLATTAATASAFAGELIPAPLAGAAGPAGLLAAGALYLGYRAYKRFASR